MIITIMSASNNANNNGQNRMGVRRINNSTNNTSVSQNKNYGQQSYAASTDSMQQNTTYEPNFQKPNGTRGYGQKVNSAPSSQRQYTQGAVNTQINAPVQVNSSYNTANNNNVSDVQTTNQVDLYTEVENLKSTIAELKAKIETNNINSNNSALASNASSFNNNQNTFKRNRR